MADPLPPQPPKSSPVAGIVGGLVVLILIIAVVLAVVGLLMFRRYDLPLIAFITINIFYVFLTNTSIIGLVTSCLSLFLSVCIQDHSRISIGIL